MTRRDRRDGPLAVATLTALALLGTLPASAQPAPQRLPAPRPQAAPSQPAPRPSAGPATPDPALEAARLVYEALPLAERIDLQDGLVWTGDYSGALDGTFGRMTFASLVAFQTRHKFAPDGILTAPAKALLAETARTKKAALGFQPVDDKATGVRISLPTRLLGPPTRREAGSRWVGRDGRVQIDTFAFPEGDLAQLFERMKAEAPGRKVVYAVLRPDWFVVSDEAGGQHGYARFVRGPQGIRGFLFSVDASLGAELDRVVIATAGRFEPFPGAPAVATPAAPTPGPAPGAATPTPTAPTPAAPPAPPPVAAAASGLVVAPGKVLTAAAAVAGCRAVTVAGRPASVTVADAGGIATLGSTGGEAGALRLGAASGALTVLASGESGGRASLVAVPAEMAGDRLAAALQRGALGAPVLDGSGALVGLVLGRPDERRAVAGLIPPAAYGTAGAEAIAAAIGAAGGSVDRAGGGATTTTGRLIAAWTGRVVAVGCQP